jgi:hypothetical protein
VKRVVVGLATAGLVAACVDFSVDPNEVAAIEFAPFPTPMVIQGDTLRNAAGTRYQLDVKVYTSDGKLATGRRVTFLTADTLSRVTAANFLVANSGLLFGPTTLNSRVVASVGGLQSVVRQVAVVPRPTTFARQGTATRDTIAYRSPGTAADTSMALQVRVGAETNGTTPVPSYLVGFRLLNFAGAAIPATDTTRAFFLVADDGRVTTSDTTDGSGIAHRRLRFRIRAGQAAVDSIRIVAEIRLPRQTFPAVEWIVRVQPR